MPRQARLDAAGAVHHVMLRGIERRRIFEDDADRRDLVDRLARLIPEERFTCFAWSLMPNHVHLVLRTGPVPLSRLMARLGTGYACRFNVRHRRVGHLFQNRFKSVLVESDSYGQKLVRYVHLNPVRAGLVRSLAELADYPWTGHTELTGRRLWGVVSSQEVLGWFHPELPKARTLLLESMARELGEGSEPLSIGDQSLASAPSSDERGGREAPRDARHGEPVLLSKPGGWDLDRLISWVCARIGAEESEVRRGRRTRSASTARAIVAYLATAELGLRGVDVGRPLSLGSGATSRAISRGRELVRRAPFLEVGPGRPIVPASRLSS